MTLEYPLHVRLRQITLDDAQEMASWDTPATTLEDQQRVIVNHLLDSAMLSLIALYGELQPVGWAMITRRAAWDEIGWVVAPRCRRRGFGSRIGEILVGMTRRPTLARIAAANLASMRIAQKIGMRRPAGDTEGLWWLD